LLAKHPRAGFVKTRLAADTSPSWAAAVADAFLRDLLRRLAGIDARRVLAFTPTDAASRVFFTTVAAPHFEPIPQVDGDLGQRMESLLRTLFAAGSSAGLLIGADSPTLPIAFIEQAFQELETGADVVLGPAMDGGYYLLGCARQVPPIFAGITWSGPHVLAETIACLEDTPARLALLPPWYDVDTLGDWWTLQGHLAALRRAGLDSGLQKTLALPPPCLQNSALIE